MIVRPVEVVLVVTHAVAGVAGILIAMGMGIGWVLGVLTTVVAAAAYQMDRGAS